MMKLVWINDKPTWVTCAEMEERAEFAVAVFSIPEEPVAEPMPFMYEPKHGIDLAKRFDAEMAEMMDERNAEKAHVRNRRRADRKHKLTPKMRKEQEYMRNRNICMKMVDFGTWDDIPIVEGRVRSADKIARADWELESAEIAEDEMIARFNAELEEFNRKWREEAEAEQNRMREYRKLRDLHEWLKYA